MKIKCDYCGKIFDYNGGLAHYNRAKKHFCSRSCQNVIHGLARRTKDKQDKGYKIWCNVKKRAKKNGTFFDLEIQDIPTIPKYCPVLGIEIKANIKAGPIDSSPSLDRVNPKKGYTKDNIRIISNRANRIKSDATIKELELVLNNLKQYEKIHNKNKQ